MASTQHAEERELGVQRKRKISHQSVQQNNRRLGLESLEHRWLLTAIAVPSSTSGEIDSGEVDSYWFEAREGALYSIDSTAERLFMPTVELRDGDGKLLRDGTPIHWTAPSGGTFFLNVLDGKGTYQLDIEAIDYLDDHGNSLSMATALDVPFVKGGEINVSHDLDFFSFKAKEGVQYEIYSSSVTLTGLRTLLRDSDGNYLGRHLFSQGEASQSLVWTSPTTATYFVSVDDTYYEGEGAYSLGVRAIPDDHGGVFFTATSINDVPSLTKGKIEFGNDVDFFSFPTVAGTTYRLSALRDQGGLLPIVIYLSDGVTVAEGPCYGCQWNAPSSGTYFLAVSGADSYQVEIDFVAYDDDHGQEATMIAVGSQAAGQIEVLGDADYFSFSAVGGTIYNFFASGAPGLTVGLAVYDVDRQTQLESAGQRRFTHSLGPLISWKAPSSDVYFVRVYDAGADHVGAYTLHLEEPIDDQRGGVAEATPISLPMTIEGNFDYQLDSDVYSFYLEAGTRFRTVLRNDHVFASQRVLAPGGLAVIEPLGINAQAVWVAPVDGTYFVEVYSYDWRQYENSLGPYKVTVEDLLDCDFDDLGDGCDADDLSLLYIYHFLNGGIFFEEFRENPFFTTAPVDEQIRKWLADASSPDNPLKAKSTDVYVVGDIDLDGDVDSDDLGTLLSSFGSDERKFWSEGDMNGDFRVDSADLGLMLNNFGHMRSTASPGMATAASSVDVFFREFDEDDDEAAKKA